MRALRIVGRLLLIVVVVVLFAVIVGYGVRAYQNRPREETVPPIVREEEAQKAPEPDSPPDPTPAPTGTVVVGTQSRVLYSEELLTGWENDQLPGPTVFSATSAGYNVLAVSTDPGTIIVAGTAISLPHGATIVVFSEGAMPTVEVWTGFNENTGHFNVSAYLDARNDLDEARAELLGLQSRENKRQAILIVVAADTVTVTSEVVVDR